MKVLVAFDTKSGTTAEVAEAVTDTLREAGLEAELLAADDVSEVAGYGAVVVGAPLYMARWLPGGHRVLSLVEAVPEPSRPAVAVFALGPRKDEGPESWVRPRGQFERALAEHSDLAPVATALFGGAEPPGKKERRDIRDWDAIRAWALQVAGALGASA